MSASIISVEGLSKKYRLGVVGVTTLRDDVARYFRRGQNPATETGEFWALKDVSFSVGRGEVLGILGRNGAGKSTLLKILSRITDPTAGRAVLRGRVASLLEVGTGFHQDLTGRENVFLNGAILGMKKNEISARFDEIVAFAEIAQFIDTPVKHYSSGMRVRLAFAVAAHLDSEIMIIDEVLAVGDVDFQRKCMGKMEGIARGEGRTVLFVSHNLGAVQSLCSRVLYLSHGQVRGLGDVEEQLQAYLHDTGRAQSSMGKPVPLGRNLELRRLAISPGAVATGDRITFELHLASRDPVRITDLSVLIFSAYGSRVAVIDLRKPSGPYVVAGENRIGAVVAGLPLVEGEYRIGLYVKTAEFHENVMDLTTLAVTPRASGNGVAPYAPQHRGVVELETQLYE